jgi:DNA repair protein RadA/Sms
MEGDPISSWRLLRAVKNRFGSTNEVGVLEMTDRGLIDVEDPSRAFLSERRDSAIGSVIVATMEGTRPLLVEIQALTTPSSLPTPRRVATGLDLNRLLLVCAVLTRRVGMKLADQDIVVNVAGGLRISEPAADLGLALALASSLRNAPVEGSAAAVGEVGLSGEVRRVPQIGRRIQEVSRLGLQRCLVPSSARDECQDVDGVQPIPVETLAEAIQICVPRGNRAQPAVL